MDGDTTRPLVKMNPLMVLFVVVQLVVIIIAISIFASFGGDEIVEEGQDRWPSVELNIKSILPASYQMENGDTVEYSLFKIVEQNVPSGVPDAKATVREDAIFEKYFEDYDVNYLSAIVDIPELGQSYQLFYEYSENPQNQYLMPNNAIVFLCVKDEKYVRYADFECNDIYSQQTRNSLLSTYLGYTDFDDFYAYIDEEDLGRINIVSRYYEYTDAQSARYVADTKKFVESLGIAADLFEYHIVPPEELEVL